MAMSVIWTGDGGRRPVLCGLALGNGAAVAAAALEGAAAGVELCLSMAGALCLWLGVMEVMRRSGLAGRAVTTAASRATTAVPGFRPERSGDGHQSLPTYRPTCWGWAMRPLPWALEAARRMSGEISRAWPRTACACWWCATPPPSSCMPTTVATCALAAAGSAAPFDILPAVWLASAASVDSGTAGGQGTV